MRLFASDDRTIIPRFKRILNLGVNLSIHKSIITKYDYVPSDFRYHTVQCKLLTPSEILNTSYKNLPGCCNYNGDRDLTDYYGCSDISHLHFMLYGYSYLSDLEWCPKPCSFICIQKMKIRYPMFITRSEGWYWVHFPLKF